MLKLNLLLIIALLTFHINGYYQQNSKIYLYTHNNQEKSKIKLILNKFNIVYEETSTLNKNDNGSLYIIDGHQNQLPLTSLPMHYIYIQNKKINGEVSNNLIRLMANAISVWDMYKENISKYSHKIKHFCYLPNENYEFIDPVILPCFLPIHSLNSYKEVLIYSNSKKSDISDHIPALFCHSMFQKPNIVVEAGIRWGDGSTIPLYAASRNSGAQLIGIDIVDCSKIYNKLLNSTFVRMDDTLFPKYLHETLKKKSIDFVFIDTTHQVAHTINEIKSFSSILSDNGALGFHDSNPLPRDPDGVIIALKQYFNIHFDQSKYLNDTFEKDNYLWNIIHYPYCNGMTIIKRIQKIH